MAAPQRSIAAAKPLSRDGYGADEPRPLTRAVPCRVEMFPGCEEIATVYYDGQTQKKSRAREM